MVDFAALQSGATVETYEPPHARPELSGRAAIGDGIYTLFQSGRYPQTLTIDLGRQREIKEIAVQFRKHEYKADWFTLEYAGDGGRWHRLKEEKGWAQAAGATYRLLLERPVIARRLRLTVRACGFHASVSDGRPLASLRLKNLRDGLEDYEYFALLRRRAADAADRIALPERRRIEALLGLDDIIRDHAPTQRSRAEVMAWRTEVGNLVEALERGAADRSGGH